VRTRLDAAILSYRALLLFAAGMQNAWAGQYSWRWTDRDIMTPWHLSLYLALEQRAAACAQRSAAAVAGVA